MSSTIFPIKNYTTILPDGFQTFPLDMNQPEFRELMASGCSCVTPVNSPVGWEIYRPGAADPEHLDLFFIVSGKFVLETAKGIIPAGPGSVLHIVSWEDRYLKLAEDGRHVYVRFDNPERYPLCRENRVNYSPVAEEVDFYVRTLQQSNPSLPDARSYTASLTRLLHIIFQRELHENIVFDHETVTVLQKKLNTRQGNFEVLPIAKEMGMSISTFRNFCLKNFGKPPRAVLEEVRMTRARGLLDFSLKSIDEIANELGFADRFAFSRAFCRYCGISPAAFRKRYVTGK